MDDIRWIEGLIYIVAVIGGLLLPVFKQIREKRTGKPIVLPGEEGEEARTEASDAPMFEDREPWDVPEPKIGVPAERERQVGEFAEAQRSELESHQMAESFTEARAAEPPPPPPPITVRPSEPEPVLFSDFQAFSGAEAKTRRRAISARVLGARSDRRLADRRSLRRAIVMKEILDRPVGLREGPEGKPPGWL